MSDHAALIERARKLGGHSRTTDAIMRRLADALEQSQRDLAFERLRSFDMEMDARAVVEAQALEQAARFLRERNWAWNHTDGAMEAARAVELLAIDKSRETR